MDHNIRSSKLLHSDHFYASLDLTNAFGSLPHWTIFDALSVSGVGADFTQIIRDLYTDAVTVIKTSMGSSVPVGSSVGVRQGDPLSSLIFNLTIDFILRRIQLEGEGLSILEWCTTS